MNENNTAVVSNICLLWNHGDAKEAVAQIEDSIFCDNVFGVFCL